VIDFLTRLHGAGGFMFEVDAEAFGDAHIAAVRHGLASNGSAWSAGVEITPKGRAALPQAVRPDHDVATARCAYPLASVSPPRNI